ncbi:MAG: hypothetical protein HQL82_08925 [Magnetococcales bacterium]|nr:hypothetical protein [Magnetococcales bacterium]
MNRKNSTLALVTLIAGLTGCNATASSQVGVADPETAPAARSAAPAVEAPKTAAVHYAAKPATPAPAPADALEAVRVAHDGAVIDPADQAWQSSKPRTVTLQPQNVTTPNNLSPAVTEMTVRSVHNGQWLSILLEWNDPTKSDRLVVDQFGDQVAVQLPLRFRADAPYNPMMGAPDERVNIIQWRAAFQADLDRKRSLEVRDLYPHAHSDLYPDKVLNAIDLRAYLGAAGVDNPVAAHRASPVLDQVAEGFGSLTVKQHQEADGQGTWSNGQWHVVITLPMAPEGTNAPNLTGGDQSTVAFAVWEGGNQEVGSRKAWSDWVPLTLAK